MSPWYAALAVQCVSELVLYRFGSGYPSVTFAPGDSGY